MTQRVGPTVSLPEFKCRHLHVLICKMGLLPGSWDCLEDEPESGPGTRNV